MSAKICKQPNNCDTLSRNFLLFLSVTLLHNLNTQSTLKKLCAVFLFISVNILYRIYLHLSTVKKICGTSDITRKKRTPECSGVRRKNYNQSFPMSAAVELADDIAFQAARKQTCEDGQHLIRFSEDVFRLNVLFQRNGRRVHAGQLVVLHDGNTF